MKPCHPCADCGAPATTHRNIGGVLAWRCPACLLLAEQADDEAVAATMPAIPPDLAATGWVWVRDFLHQPYPERPDGPGVSISTATFPLPGTPAPRGDCFTQARTLDRLHAEHEARRAVEAAQPKRPARRPKPRAAEQADAPAPRPAARVGEQLTLELEAI